MGEIVVMFKQADGKEVGLNYSDAHRIFGCEDYSEKRNDIMNEFSITSKVADAIHEYVSMT